MDSSKGSTFKVLSVEPVFPGDSRREFLRRSAFLAGGVALSPLVLGFRLGFGLGSWPTARAGASEPAPATALPTLDREVEEFMKARAVPGTSLAVLRDGKLLYAKGYGFADREKKTPVSTRTRFRIASLSKPITALAAIRLMEERKLTLDGRAVDLLPQQLRDQAQAAKDPRWKQVTVEQLLHHTGGWDRGKSFDPMFHTGEIARKLKLRHPPRPSEVIRYMLDQPLDFDPGTQYAYSNFGYCILGRIIERLTGDGYEEAVRKLLLRPLDAAGMRIGRSLPEQRGAEESLYYERQPSKTRCIFPDTNRGDVPFPDGGFHLEAMDSHGGWVTTATEYAAILRCVQQPLGGKRPVLSPESIAGLVSPPPPPVSRTKTGTIEDVYYGLGWQVRRLGNSGKVNLWHTGSLPGTTSIAVLRWDGFAWVFLANQRSEDAALPDGAIDPALHQGVDGVKSWPDVDLFQSHV